MPKTGDGASKRLRELIAFRAKRTHDYSAPLAKFLSINDEPLQVDDPLVWTQCARIALSLDKQQRDSAILMHAFQTFGRDPKNPFDWRALAQEMSWVLFDSKAPGRPSEWTGPRYCELLEAVDRRKQTNGYRSDRKACEDIATDRTSRSYFRKANAEGLRKALKRARSFEHNEILGAIVDETVRHLAETNEVKWSSVRSPKVAKIAAEHIAARWRRREKAS